MRARTTGMLMSPPCVRGRPAVGIRSLPVDTDATGCEYACISHDPPVDRRLESAFGATCGALADAVPLPGSQQGDQVVVDLDDQLGKGSTKAQRDDAATKTG